MENEAPQSLDVIRKIVTDVLAAEGKTRSQAKIEILVHAMPIFASRGLDRTTVQHLLDAANISRRTFYKYFKNKVDVLEALYQVFNQNTLLLMQEEADRSNSVSEIIYNCVSAYIDYHVSIGSIMRLLTEEALRSDSVLAKHRDKAQGMIVERISREVSKAENVEMDPLVLRTLIWNMENYSLYLLKESDCSDAELERCKRILSAMSEAAVLDRPCRHKLLKQAMQDES